MSNVIIQDIQGIYICSVILKQQQKMKTSYKRTLILALGFIFSATLLSANDIKDDEIKNSNKHVKSEVIKEEAKFEAKVNDTLEVLRSGFGEEVNVYEAGNCTFYDFSKNDNVARLIINNDENVLRLIQKTIK